MSETANRYRSEQARELLAGIPAEQQRFMKFCRALSRRAAYRFGVQTYHGDITQDLAMHLLVETVPAFAEGQIDSDAFVLTSINAARAIAQRYQRMEIRQRHLDPIDRFDDGCDDRFLHATPELLRDDTDPEAALLAREDARAREQAIAHVRARLRAVPTLAPAPTVSAEAPKPRNRRNRKRERAGRQAARLEPASLHELLVRLGWSEDKAARKLGLDAWPNDPGVRFAPPGSILYRRVLRAAGGRDVREEMSATLRRWAEQLGFEPEDYRGLADFLGVHYTTFFRWQTGRTVPTPALRAKLSMRVHAASGVGGLRPWRGEA